MTAYVKINRSLIVNKNSYEKNRNFYARHVLLTLVGGPSVDKDLFWMSTVLNNLKMWYSIF